MEKLKTKKEDIIIIAITIILALIMCSIFLKFHMITDTYWNIGLGYEKYKIAPLKDGRIINYLSLSIAQLLNMPFEIYQFIMMLSSIIFYSMSGYYIYKYLIEKINDKNRTQKIILFLGSFVTIFNVMTVESFAYTEMVIALSILMFTKGAILLDKGNKKSIIKSLILVLIGGLCYQGTINFFITLSVLLFAIKERQSIKSWIKQLSKIVLISMVSLTLMLITINLTNYIINEEQARIGQSIIPTLDKIILIIMISMETITGKTFELFPKYLITINIAITLIFILFSIKTKNVGPILKYLFIIFIAVFSCTVPTLIQSSICISARLCFSIGAIIGISIIYIIFQRNNKITEIILLILSVIAICINIYNYVNIGIMNIKTKDQEEKYVNQINECILKYEKQTGIEIKKVALLREKVYKNTYLEMPSNTFTAKAISVDYSNLHCLNYYTNRKLEITDMDKEIFFKYFIKQNDEEFNENQVRFKDNVVYICIY